MSDLVFRTEELTNNQIAELYVASDYEQSIIDKLKAPSPVLLIGSRGVGKSFLFKMSEIQMLQEFSEKKILPVFLTFRKASLLKTSNDTSVLINTLTKYIDWKYEHEWRIVEINDKQRNEVGYKIKFVKPKEIILGLKSNDFLWKINNTGKSSDEIKPDELIRYSEDILGTDCFQYQITTSDKGYKWEKIIRI